MRRPGLHPGELFSDPARLEPMDMVTLIGILVVAGLAIVLIGAMINYMSSLVKSAYQIKIELRADLESGLQSMRDDIDRRAKWAKGEMIEETAKIRDSLTQQANDRTSALRESLLRAVVEARDADLTAIAAMADRVGLLDRRISSLEQETAYRRDMTLRARHTPGTATEATPPPPPQAPAPAPTSAPSPSSPSPSSSANARG
ncbi:hypothetical protein Rru_A2080 [Rhodospirillum rubrum ATCC 11170]|uniref:Uncharacterized protein n=2 Tax=Rhodospirillum rubrum TaxID=1085 RepID=Q2RSL5_RHORT|nr:hypothetical protein Rru_A2080 [Rhodospirillum rubrum ATCC 11170]MBK5954485.1 hypothetical protein [Rhodospirillum rubrum]HAP99320.1 hypothetical protein [Rhodospirillum rubrum]HCF18305.1 hypothetical protein [Rhodospirillum rubrum]